MDNVIAMTKISEEQQVANEEAAKLLADCIDEMLENVRNFRGTKTNPDKIKNYEVLQRLARQFQDEEPELKEIRFTPPERNARNASISLSFPTYFDFMGKELNRLRHMMDLCDNFNILSNEIRITLCFDILDCYM